MATIKVGSARIDENGNLKGGKAGDQTGREVSTQNFYMHSKGWYIIRAKSIDHADRLAEAMLEACNNSNIGYDQYQRTGVIAQLKKAGSLRKIAVKTECDCSSLVRACVIQATGKDPGNFTTATEAGILMSANLFEKKECRSSADVYNGDILVTKKKGHTVIVVSGRERKKKNAIEVDGLWGRDTTIAAQRVFGTTVDGIVSNQYSKYKDTNPGLLDSTFEWEKEPGKKGSSLIKAIQRKVAVEDDGFIGPKTIKAMQKWLGVTPDGYLSKPSLTIMLFQKWLNENYK